MRLMGQRPRAAPLPARGGALAALACLALLALPGAAQADYEQVPEHFGVSGEAEQLKNATAMAVNVNGVGGVEAGSLYVVGYNARVVRFAPGKEGEEPQFREAWGWGVGSSKEGAPETGYQRCGPALTTEPALHTFHTCKPPSSNAPFGGEEIGHFELLAGVAVDQATGDVYVLNVHYGPRKRHLIEVFTATGTPVGEGFADAGSEPPGPGVSGESIAEGPEKLHEIFPTTGALAVDEAGTVYVNDSDYGLATVEHPQGRVMSFEPQSPGDYEHYVYAGQGKDIAFTFGEEPFRISLAAGGKLVTANLETIREYQIGAGNTPLCNLVVKGQLSAMTANPLTGEVFYFTIADRKIHRLSACNEGTGKFAEAQAGFKPTPLTTSIKALAFDPTLSWGPLRPAGVLYAADAEQHEGPPVQLGIGDVFAPAKAAAPPAVEAESVANTTTASATLKARIDPHGFTTSYRFEYLSEAEYLANGGSFEGPDVPARAPAKDGQLAGGAVTTVGAAVSGLVPDTEYRFRAIAVSECEGKGEPPCETVGETATFATYPPATAPPPDGRAYELVSPPQKSGGEVFPAQSSVASCGVECKPPGGGSILVVFPMQSAPGGDAVTYMGYPFSPTEGAAVFNSYVSRRDASGWQTTAMSPSLLASSFPGNEHLTYSPQLDEDVISQGSPQLSASAPAGYPNLYLQSAADPGALEPILSAPPPHRGQGSLVLSYAGASADYSCQLFAANDALTPETAFAPEPPDPTFAGRDLYEWCGGQLSLINVLPGDTTVATGSAIASPSPDAHAISEDGSRVFWSDGAGNLYLREDGELTREVPGASPTVKFLTANARGSEVLLSNGQLDEQNEAGDAYEAAADLSEGEGGFQGIAGASEDLSRIYFVDTAVLPGSGENERHQSAQATKPNLYLYEEGAPTRFIATLLPSDGVGGSSLNDWTSAPSRRSAEASPGGRYLAFGSFARLTGHANVGLCEEVTNSENEVVLVNAPCKEVFLYDSATEQLSCPSCNPTGEAPLGNSTLRRIQSEREWQSQPRYVTDSGRLFFDSSDRISPLDVNGRVEDVYEAEPQGVGSCERAGGCVSLISPGTGSVDSNLLAMDSSGANAFFTSRERLVTADKDELIDLYDARVGGGFPGETETTEPECQGESCQPPASVPNDSTPASSSFEGAGNVVERQTPARCAKGKVRRQGRCVARKHHAAKHHKRAKRHHRRAANANLGGAK